MIGAASSSAAHDNAAVSSAWLLGYFVIVTIGELYLSPTGLSLVTKVAPARYLSMTMGVWLATSFLGNFIAGWLGSFWSGMEKRDFFLMIAAIAAAAAAVIFACNRPLRSALKD
jgi:POT family proton-dependent oligopeptide transporter